MSKYLKILILSCLLLAKNNLAAHCQMPCGIYHDDMVYEQIDQFVETSYKAITMLNQSKFTTVKERNEFVRWVMEKDKICDDTAYLINQYFLQQKIKPDETDTVKRLVSAHNLLCMLVAIKQNVEISLVKEFNREWENFKLMFHKTGYEEMMDKKERDDLEALRKTKEQEKSLTPTK